MLASLVLADRSTARPALVALAAAVEASPLSEEVSIALVRGPDAITAAIAEGRRRGTPVVVAWSFFSSDAMAAAAELREVRAFPVRGERDSTPPLRGYADHDRAESYRHSPERHRSVLHVAGGVHASAAPEETLALGFDLVARGEGEGTIVALLRAVSRGEDPRSAPGLCCATPHGFATSGRADAVDLDAVPASSTRLGKALAAEVTRGCIWACRFCQTPFLHRARFRHRSVGSVRAWARHGVALGHRDFRFLTPSALSYGAEREEVRLEAVEELLAAVREEIGPGRRIFFGTFPSELRPEHVRPDTIALLARYVDHRELLIGGQSGSDRLLAEMDRGHGVAEILCAVECAVAGGFVPSVDFVTGFPGETEADREASRVVMARIAGLGGRVHGHAFLPLPGTPWRDAPAGVVDPATMALLDRLASRGRAFGQWRVQQRLAAELRRRRSA